MSPPRLPSRSNAGKQMGQSKPVDASTKTSSPICRKEAASNEVGLRRSKRLKAEPPLKSCKDDIAESGRSSIVSKASKHTDEKPNHHERAIAKPQFVSFASTADLLIHLSTRIIELMNERDYNSPFLSCLAQDVETPGNTGRSNVIEGFRMMAEALPDYHNEIQNATCTVDEDASMAKVVMTMRVSGFLYGTIRQSSSLFTWIRRGDRWSCSRYCVLRGIQEFE